MFGKLAGFGDFDVELGNAFFLFGLGGGEVGLADREVGEEPFQVGQEQGEFGREEGLLELEGGEGFFVEDDGLAGDARFEFCEAQGALGGDAVVGVLRGFFGGAAEAVFGVEIVAGVLKGGGDVFDVGFEEGFGAEEIIALIVELVEEREAVGRLEAHFGRAGILGEVGELGGFLGEIGGVLERVELLGVEAVETTEEDDFLGQPKRGVAGLVGGEFFEIGAGAGDFFLQGGAVFGDERGCEFGVGGGSVGGRGGRCGFAGERVGREHGEERRRREGERKDCEQGGDAQEGQS